MDVHLLGFKFEWHWNKHVLFSKKSALGGFGIPFDSDELGSREVTGYAYKSENPNEIAYKGDADSKDWKQKSQHYITIVDCGADGICAEDHGYGDNEKSYVYFDDYTQFTLNANVLTFRPTAQMKPYHWYAILMDGGVDDYYDNPATGVGLFTRFRTGPARVQPSAWRIAATTDARFNDNPPWMPLEANLTNSSLTKAGEGWRVTELEFYNYGSCGGNRLLGTPISSGNPGMSNAYKAFDGDLNTYWDYDLDISDSEFAPKNKIKSLYNNETHAIELEDEILTCNNHYNDVRRCDQPGNYWLGVYLGRTSGDNVWSFRV